MSEYLPFVVVGLVSGAVYALASMGLVLTYTTSGVFNFAHGAVGMFATYVFYSLRVNAGVPTVVAVAVAVLVVGPLMGLVIDHLLLRRLAGAPTATYIVTSLGLLVALQSLAQVIWGASTRQVAPIFPTSTYRLPGVNVGIDQTIVIGIALLAGLVLALFFRSTHLGLQTRAVVGDPNLTELVGTNSSLVTSFSWMLGCAFAALSGILFAPFIQLDSLLLTLLVVQAFGAAVIGRLRSFTLTNLGAYGVGIAAALATKLVANTPGLAGLPTAIPTLVLFLVLVVSPKGRFVEVTTPAAVSGSGRPNRHRRFPWQQLVLVAAVAALLPRALNGSQLLTATTTLAFVLIFSSLSLTVGLSRQVALCHTVFAVFGATTLAHLLDAGVPFGVALLLAGLAMVPVGAFLAIPAIRLSGLFLALATFGFAVLAQSLLFPASFTFGRAGSVFLRRPSLFTTDTAFFYFTLLVVIAGVATIEVIRVSRLGRLLRSLADSPTAVQSLGINPMASRVLVFCISAFFAAIAGGLLGSLVQSVNQTSFDSFLSLVWLTVLVTGGMATFSGSVLAAVLFVAVPAVFTSPTVAEWQPVAFGVLAIMLAQTPNGLAGLLFRRPDLVALARRAERRGDRRRTAERELVAALAKAG